MSSPAAFSRTLERSGSRLMIRSACANCGASQLVSKHDGSLADWEDGHRCEMPQPNKKGPASTVDAPENRLSRVAGRKRFGDA